MKPYSVEQLNSRLDRVNGWINNCDQKASILLAFIGAVIAVFFTSDVISSGRKIIIEPFISYWLKGEPAVFSIRASFLFFLLFPILINLYKMLKCLLLVLNPKTVIKEFHEDISSKTQEDSLLHFLSIALKDYDAFQKSCKTQTEDEYLNDLLTQIFCNSKICNDKFENYKKGLHYFKLSVIWIVIEVVCVFILP